MLTSYLVVVVNAVGSMMTYSEILPGHGKKQVRARAWQRFPDAVSVVVYGPEEV